MSGSQPIGCSEALASYQADLAISESLVKSDPGNASWKRGLSVTYDNIGDVEVKQGDLAQALKSYSAALDGPEQPGLAG